MNTSYEKESLSKKAENDDKKRYIIPIVLIIKFLFKLVHSYEEIKKKKKLKI